MSSSCSDSTKKQRWVFLAVISLGLLLIGLDNSILYTALPELDRQLGTTSLQELWIINAYPLVMSGLLLGTGTLGDKVGHRLMFLIGLAIFTAASLAAAFSPTAWALVAARAALGFGAATMMPATLALIRVTFYNERELNLAIGIWGSVATIGSATGPVVGGLLLEHFWWGSIFLINVPIGIIAICATIVVAPANMPDPRRRWDATSSLYALLALTGGVMTIKAAASTELPSGVLWASLAIAIVFSAAFTWRQKRSPEPLLDLDIFTDRIFTGGVLAAAGAMIVLGGTELMTTQRLQLAAGFSPLESGTLIAIAAVSALPASIIGGGILHRIGFRPLITGGFLISTAGILLAIASTTGWIDTELHVGPHNLGMLGAMVLLGFGCGAAMSVSSTAIIGSAPITKAGMASGVEEVSYEFGHLITVAVTGSLLPLFYAQALGDPHAHITPSAINETAFTTAYVHILWVLLAAGVLLAVLTAVCFKGNPRTGSYVRQEP